MFCISKVSLNVRWKLFLSYVKLYLVCKTRNKSKTITFCDTLTISLLAKKLWARGFYDFTANESETDSSKKSIDINK